MRNQMQFLAGDAKTLVEDVLPYWQPPPYWVLFPGAGGGTNNP